MNHHPQKHPPFLFLWWLLHCPTFSPLTNLFHTHLFPFQSRKQSRAVISPLRALLDPLPLQKLDLFPLPFSQNLNFLGISRGGKATLELFTVGEKAKNESGLRFSLPVDSPEGQKLPVAVYDVNATRGAAECNSAAGVLSPLQQRLHRSGDRRPRRDRRLGSGGCHNRPALLGQEVHRRPAVRLRRLGRAQVRRMYRW